MEGSALLTKDLQKNQNASSGLDNDMNASQHSMVSILSLGADPLDDFDDSGDSDDSEIESSSESESGSDDDELSFNDDFTSGLDAESTKDDDIELKSRDEVDEKREGGGDNSSLIQVSGFPVKEFNESENQSKSQDATPVQAAPAAPVHAAPVQAEPVQEKTMEDEQDNRQPELPDADRSRIVDIPTQEKGEDKKETEKKANGPKRRGVMPMTSSDSLFGGRFAAAFRRRPAPSKAESDDQQNELPRTKTRRGGRRGREDENIIATSETPEETLCTTTDGPKLESSIVGVEHTEQPTIIPNDEAGDNHNQATVPSSSNQEEEPRRGVQRTSTSDSLTGVDTKQRHNAVHGSRTRRGGRRNDVKKQDDSDNKAEAETSGHTSRKVFRTNTLDSVTQTIMKLGMLGRSGAESNNGEEKQRGVQRTSTSDSLTGVDTQKHKAVHGSRTRRGGRRNEHKEAQSANDDGNQDIEASTDQGVTHAEGATHSNTDSMARKFMGFGPFARTGSNGEVEEKRRGVQRTSTSDSLTGVDTQKHKSVHGSRTRRGGRRNEHKEAQQANDDGSQDIEASNDQGDIHAEGATPSSTDSTARKFMVFGPFSRTGSNGGEVEEKRRGVQRTSTSDSLTGVGGAKEKRNVMDGSKTRRGGRRNKGQEQEERNDDSRGDVESEINQTESNERGIPRTSTMDSLTRTLVGLTSFQRPGNTGSASGKGNGEEKQRGVQRTSTSDSLTGVDTKKRLNPFHGAKTRRGGRRNKNSNDSDQPDTSGTSTEAEINREKVARTSTMDSLAGRIMKFGALRSGSGEEVVRGVARTSTSDSLTGADTKNQQKNIHAPKTRRGGRRNRPQESVDQPNPDESNGYPASES